MKSAALVFIFLLFAAAISAQEPCRLDAKAAPLLLNLQLGILPEQAQNILGRDLKIKIRKNGERTFFQNYIKNPAPESLRGVRALYLRFFDRRLYQIEIFYEPRQDLQMLEDVSNTLATQLSFPDTNWQIKNNRAEIACGENSIVADNILNPRIELTNETTRAKIIELRKKK